ncbi:hypothetical protein CAEBREN_30710 [Caenorhabditis brenneri]|uniref:Uncharacterized protein n=1 Tax=Caenorhabditis brenneri TaxID=135651 RepID=G0N0C4_CAEBE|nr:hypothetical protein CAEBREN_30710 [Caenorhabditis brenneri]
MEEGILSLKCLCGMITALGRRRICSLGISKLFILFFFNPTFSHTCSNGFLVPLRYNKALQSF